MAHPDTCEASKSTGSLGDDWHAIRLQRATGRRSTTWNEHAPVFDRPWRRLTMTSTPLQQLFRRHCQRACAVVVLLCSAACGSSHGLVNRPDASTLRDAAGSTPDAEIRADGSQGPPRVDAAAASCAPQNARIVALCGPATDRVGAFWDGAKCVPHESNCEGPDCFSYSGTSTMTLLDRCEADHASCEPTLCRRTGGAWDSFGACAAVYRCGRLERVDCDGPHRALCNCGAGAKFDPIRGCINDSTCGAAELCERTDGRWLDVGDCAPCNSCDGVCTRICSMLRAPVCDCGPFARFDPIEGCRSDATMCAQSLQRATCEREGGRWIARDCCTVVDECGVFGQPLCNSDCVQTDTCVCPTGMKWTGRGCVSEFCRPRPEGGRCSSDGQCQSNLKCHCGQCAFPSCHMDTGCPCFGC